MKQKTPKNSGGPQTGVSSTRGGQPVDARRVLRSKWRNLEDSSAKGEASPGGGEDGLGGDKPGRIAVAGAGLQSEYMKALLLFAGQTIVKKVKGWDSSVIIGAEGTGSPLEIFRAIASLDTMTQLAEQVKRLVERELVSFPYWQIRPVRKWILTLLPSHPSQSRNVL